MTKQTANIDDSFAGLYFLSNEMFSKMRMSSKLNISSVFDKRSKVVVVCVSCFIFFPNHQVVRFECIFTVSIHGIN